MGETAETVRSRHFHTPLCREFGVAGRAPVAEVVHFHERDRRTVVSFRAAAVPCAFAIARSVIFTFHIFFHIKIVATQTSFFLAASDGLLQPSSHCLQNLGKHCHETLPFQLLPW